MKTVYTNYGKKVIVENGIVTYSDFSLCTVGQKPDTKALKACGWMKEKSAAVYYVKGNGSSRNSNRFN